MSSLWNSLYHYNPKVLPKGPDVTRTVTLVDQLKAQVTYHDIDGLHSEFAAMEGNSLFEVFNSWPATKVLNAVFLYYHLF